jgi:hypothetical protein
MLSVCSYQLVLIVTTLDAMVPTRQRVITIYQYSFGPPDTVLGSAVSKESYVFFPFIDK